MPDYVTDTHALIWHLTKDARLSPAARAAFVEADAGASVIWIPGVVLVETVYLVEKSRFPAALIQQMLDLVDPPSENYVIVPLDAGVIRALQTIDREVVSDMPDRIVIASAKHLDLPLLSKDTAFAGVSDVTVIW
jgi:PIN domain nuclease of toxin-antitoxin system